jgi:hypothetical protein
MRHCGSMDVTGYSIRYAFLLNSIIANDIHCWLAVEVFVLPADA